MSSIPCLILFNHFDFFQALHKTKDKTKKAFCEGELREDDLEKQRKDAVERLALVEREKENEVGYLQNVLRNSVSEVDRLMSVNAEITTVSIHSKIIKVNCMNRSEHILKQNI